MVIGCNNLGEKIFIGILRYCLVLLLEFLGFESGCLDVEIPIPVTGKSQRPLPFCEGQCEFLHGSFTNKFASSVPKGCKDYGNAYSLTPFSTEQAKCLTK